MTYSLMFRRFENKCYPETRSILFTLIHLREHTVNIWAMSTIQSSELFCSRS